ncbi:MAG: cell division protein FtsZ [Hyphomicrobiaceae bacterium]|nr:cell division protein FtsZ [Hyphomicrobiaceae bacterium]
MSIKLELPKLTDLRPRLTVIGVGGAGCNAVNNMIAAGLTGAEFVVANTDAQALAASSAEYRIQLGRNLTEGLGAGAKPEIGEAAAEEAIEEIRAQIAGSHMVFLAAGMGGGTGTGAAAVVARIAQELGILTVGIVTKPFQFEGSRRMRMAEAGIAELRQHVDTLIVIPNQNLFRIANEKTTFAEAFVLADQVLYSGVACIIDLIVKEGLINLDFADVRSIMSGMGTAMMGTGEAEGEHRATLAAEEAIANPLLDDISLKGAKGLLLSITGGPNLTLYEVDEAATRIRREVDPEANIIVGATFDPTLGERLRVSIVASGMPGGTSDAQRGAGPQGPASLARAMASSQAPAAHGLPASSGRAAPVMPPLSGPPLTAPPMPPPMAATSPPPPPQSNGAGTTRSDALLSPAGSKVSADTSALSPPTGRPAKPDAATGAGAGNDQHRDLDDDLERRFADAMRLSADDEQDADLPGTAAFRGTWTAPGDVLIEEGLPPYMGPGQLAGRASMSDDGASRGARDRSEAGGFVPQPPSDVRRGQRRMPDIEEFPAPGQRDYHAKQADKHRPDAETGDRGAAAAGSKPSRKPGLFDRLTSIGRWATDSEAPPDPYARAARSHHDAHASSPPRGEARGSTAPGTGSSRSRNDQASELPDFFKGDKR